MLFIEESRVEGLGPIFRSNLFHIPLAHCDNSSQIGFTRKKKGEPKNK